MKLYTQKSTIVSILFTLSFLSVTNFYGSSFNTIYEGAKTGAETGAKIGAGLGVFATAVNDLSSGKSYSIDLKELIQNIAVIGAMGAGAGGIIGGAAGTIATVQGSDTKIKIKQKIKNSTKWGIAGLIVGFTADLAIAAITSPRQDLLCLAGSATGLLLGTITGYRRG